MNPINRTINPLLCVGQYGGPTVLGEDGITIRSISGALSPQDVASVSDSDAEAAVESMLSLSSPFVVVNFESKESDSECKADIESAAVNENIIPSEMLDISNFDASQVAGTGIPLQFSMEMGQPLPPVNAPPETKLLSYGDPRNINIFAIFISYMESKTGKLDEKLNWMKSQQCCLRGLYIQYLLFSEIGIALVSMIICGLKLIIALVLGKGCGTGDIYRLVLLCIVFFMDLMFIAAGEVVLLLTCCHQTCFWCMCTVLKVISFLSYVTFVAIYSATCAEGVGVMGLIVPFAVISATTYSCLRFKSFVICNSLDFIWMGCSFIYRTGYVTVIALENLR
jgi:hypothetical protein